MLFWERGTQRIPAPTSKITCEGPGLEPGEDAKQKWRVGEGGRAARGSSNKG